MLLGSLPPPERDGSILEGSQKVPEVPRAPAPSRWPGIHPVLGNVCWGSESP